MPLTRTQFDLGIDADIEGWMRQIHTFLAAHRDLAYTRDEIADELNLKKPWTDTYISFLTALTTLVATRHVKQNEVRYRQYYAAVTNKLEL